MRAVVPVLQALAMVLALCIFGFAVKSAGQREHVVRQAPPYYECNGPAATRHPRCDRD